MGIITGALTTIATSLSAQLGGDVDVQEHPGRFTEEELARTVLKHRSVRVAVEAIPVLEVDGSGLRKAHLQFAAVVICADRKGSDRHQAALDLVEEITGLLAYQKWDQPATFRAVAPADIEAANLYSGEIRGKGIAMWAVSWAQAINRQE